MATLPRRYHAIPLGLTIILLAACVLNAAEREVDAHAGFKPKSLKTATTAQTSTDTQAANRKLQPVEKTATAIQNNRLTELMAASARVPSATATALPLAGEKLEWMVFSGAGGSSSNGSFKLDVTVGQTASGRTSGGGYKLTQGFLQDFGSGSCCTGTTGNVNMTGIVDLGDLSALVSYLTGGGYALPCAPEANINNAGIVDLGDLSSLVSYLTGGGYVLPNCP